MRIGVIESFDEDHFDVQISDPSGDLLAVGIGKLRWVARRMDRLAGQQTHG